MYYSKLTEEHCRLVNFGFENKTKRLSLECTKNKKLKRRKKDKKDRMFLV